MTKKLFPSLLTIILLATILAPPEFIRVWERSTAANVVRAGQLKIATLMYNFMRLQRDPIGTNNYHALNFYLSVNADPEVRKTISVNADHAWQVTGKAGVGASYWNLAMFSVKYGRKKLRPDGRTTYWLQAASHAGILDAAKLLSAGEGEFDRIKSLMELGDPGAAMTWASEMHVAQDRQEEDRALRIAAENGSIPAMSDLGWNLINRKNPQHGEAKKWLTMAANAGDVAAAHRLGSCYNHRVYFCEERDSSEAARWYEIALGPVILFALPRITIDSDHAIRLGSMSRWYNKPHNTQKSAAYELGVLLMHGDGVPLDRERAISLFEQADGWEDSEALRAKLKEDAAIGSDKLKL